MHLGLHRDRLCSISEIAKAQRISENHLTKVIHQLGKLGLISTARGRGGGLKLARPPEEIKVGAVVRLTKEGFDLLDCGSCVLQPACALTCALAQALDAFMRVLDPNTIAGLIRPGDRTRALLIRPRQFLLIRDKADDGRKQSHWMWFIFLQLAYLGHSTSRRYTPLKISGAVFKILCSRLREHVRQRSKNQIGVRLETSAKSKCCSACIPQALRHHH
jgi:Rrf2 family nitric oxide-sensitive transcriptional repressor